MKPGNSMQETVVTTATVIVTTQAMTTVVTMILITVTTAMRILVVTLYLSAVTTLIVTSLLEYRHSVPLWYLLDLKSVTYFNSLRSHW
jgi:hypothetical protein